MKFSDTNFKKFLMLLFNTLNIIEGLLMIATAIIYYREGKSKQTWSSVTRAVLAFTTTLSVFIIVTGVLGCIGALKHHIRIIYLQISFYICIITIELMACAIVIILYTLAKRNDDLRVDFFQNSSLVEEAKGQYSWDLLQTELDCCGVDGPQDYHIIRQDIPASCCLSANPLRDGGAKRQLHATCLKDRTYFMRGCEEAVRLRDSDNNRCGALVILSMILIQLFLVFISLRLIWRIRSQRRQLQQNLQAHFES